MTLLGDKIMKLAAAVLALIALARSAENASDSHASWRPPHYDPRSTIWSDTYPGELPPRRRRSLHANFMAALMLRLDTNRDLAVQRDEFLDYLLSEAADLVDAGAGAYTGAAGNNGSGVDADTGADNGAGSDTSTAAPRVSVSNGDRTSVFHLCTSEFGDVDRDGDGRVTLDELGTSELRVRGSELSTAAWDRQVELLAAAFAAADGDNDGALTAAEHRTVRQHALSLHLEREVAFIFQRADGGSDSDSGVGGSDGELDADELAAIPRHALHGDVQRLLGHPEL